MTTPSPAVRTLRKYGLTEHDFRMRVIHQGGVCAICGQVPTRWVVDHEHKRGWKRMPAEKRVRYVRGLLCWRCNYFFMAKGITVERAQNVVRYLQEFKERLGTKWDG